MSKLRTGITVLMTLVLTGCAASWITSPSRATEDLVHDLKLEGFDCYAGLTSVYCRQIEPYVQRQPKICTSTRGCVKQPCMDLRILYEIRQDGRGVPQLTQTTERIPTTSIPASVYSEEYVETLKEYCSL